MVSNTCCAPLIIHIVTKKIGITLELYLDVSGHMNGFQAAHDTKQH